MIVKTHNESMRGASEAVLPPLVIMVSKLWMAESNRMITMIHACSGTLPAVVHTRVSVSLRTSGYKTYDQPEFKEEPCCHIN